MRFHHESLKIQSFSWLKRLGTRCSKVLNALDSFLVPDLCFGCKVHLSRGENILCAFCRNELPLTEQGLYSKNPADHLFAENKAVVKIISLCYFEQRGIMQKLIHQLKYNGKQAVGIWLGNWLGILLSREKDLPKIDWVLPVPLHQSKKRKRGYNQCEKFGKQIAAGIGSVYSEKILKRIGKQSTQTTKNKEDRIDTIRGAFAVQHPELVRHKTILLVDDVITTGATLKSCCEELEGIQGVRIFLATMAVVP